MDILVFPSIHEGLGMVSVEEQASGLHVTASTDVPSEMKVIDCVTFISLTESLGKWAKKIVSFGREYTRYFREDGLANAGDCISVEAKILETFYISLFQSLDKNPIGINLTNEYG